MDRKLVKIKEGAKFMEIQSNTLRNYIAKGKIRSYKKDGHTYVDILECAAYSGKHAETINIEVTDKCLRMIENNNIDKDNIIYNYIQRYCENFPQHQSLNSYINLKYNLKFRS